MEMERMRNWEKILNAHGHVCTSRWVRGDEAGQGLANAAQMDLDDVDAADVVISYVLPKGSMFSSGGRHVEFGYAVAKRKILINVGPEAENLFHNLPTVTTVPTIEKAMLWLTNS